MPQRDRKGPPTGRCPVRARTRFADQYQEDGQSRPSRCWPQQAQHHPTGEIRRVHFIRDVFVCVRKIICNLACSRIV
ncbi:hypothetical protein RHMOL_Rhmol06G0069800 [Rhododendron molle]|uniref:Uncharacterized protein n=1 Tax=Rhododendron molle TaxID=49168 RepID=A0ACC0NBJ4_RHOML|nr:hypothetical protein RHMOL_Rhmol06G0069800 [Rhododendron molle]